MELINYKSRIVNIKVDKLVSEIDESKPLFYVLKLLCSDLIFGADDGLRTRDPKLGKLVLYQLSYIRLQNINIS